MNDPMAKIKKFAPLNIRKITGGKDPKRLIEEFLTRREVNPEECLRESNPDTCRWMLQIGEEEELEILLEAIRQPNDTTIYMGVNVAVVPLRGAYEILTTALEIADGLVGIKVSLVGHYLVLSASTGVNGLSVEDLEYSMKLIE